MYCIYDEVYAYVKSHCNCFFLCFSSLFVDELYKYMYVANILDNSQNYAKNIVSLSFLRT